MSDAPSDAERVRALREVLTATGAGIYLATHVAGPLPAETLAAVHESDDMELRIGRVGPGRADDLEQREREARAVVAAVLKASPERLVLCHGAPEAATAIAMRLLGRERGGAGRVLVLDGTPEPVRLAIDAVAEAVGAPVERVDPPPRILPPDVALVVMSHVDVDGRLTDVATVSEAARKAGAAVLVDAGRSVGARPVEVAHLGAHAVIAETHRWLLGPESVTVAWLSPELGEAMPDELRGRTGSFGRGDLLALARSVGWLLMYVELPWLMERTERLAGWLKVALAAIDGVEIVGPSSAHAAIVAFRIRGWDAGSAAEELSSSIFAIIEDDPERDLLRASVGAWTREDELDRFVERLAELAAHGPGTVPRRPTLTVLSSGGAEGKRP